MLVVIGIIIAVSLGEWRQHVNDGNEVMTFYNDLAIDLHQDKLRLNEYIKRYENSSLALTNEIDRLQLDSYNQYSLYKSFSNWNLYSSSNKFIPQTAIYTEMASNGKLKLIKDRNLKAQLLKLYIEMYPEMDFYQVRASQSINAMGTTHLLGQFRWLLAVNNDGFDITSINLKNPIIQLNDDWLTNKQSEEFIKFENWLSIKYANNGGLIRRFESTINEIELLETEISKVLKKNKE